MTTNPGSSVHDRIQIRKWADECAAQDADDRATREAQDFAAGSLLQGRVMHSPTGEELTRVAQDPEIARETRGGMVLVTYIVTAPLVVAGLALFVLAVKWALPAVLGWLLELPVWFR